MEMTKFSDLQTIKTKISNKLLRVAKAGYHQSSYGKSPTKTIVFILGCQRSGTTLMNEIFERDLQTKVYAEQSILSSQDSPKRLRLNPLPIVKQILDKDKAPMVVLKPLVESQNTLGLLNYFEGSKGIWMFRNYKDVAISHVKKWGLKNSINDLRAIVEARPNNWRFENVSEETRDLVLKYFSEDMDPYDSVAIYWYVRNSFVFNLKLHQNARIFICNYESLVFDPVHSMEKVYQFLKREFPGKKIIKTVHSTSVGKTKNIAFSPEIKKLCDDLFEKLTNFQTQL